VRRLRQELRAAIADVWGADFVPGDEADFPPPVSPAYSTRDGDMQPILEAARATFPEPARCTIRHADVIMLNRDHQQYEWVGYAEVPIRSAGI
jgi:hypothetical protein